MSSWAWQISLPHWASAVHSIEDNGTDKEPDDRLASFKTRCFIDSFPTLVIEAAKSQVLRTRKSRRLVRPGFATAVTIGRNQCRQRVQHQCFDLPRRPHLSIHTEVRTATTSPYSCPRLEVRTISPVHYPGVQLWQERPLRSQLQAFLDKVDVKFTLLEIFRVESLWGTYNRDAMTAVLAVLPGSLLPVSARDFIRQTYRLMES